MPTVRTLLDLILGRLTGIKTMTFAGRKYIVMPQIAGGDETEEEKAEREAKEAREREEAERAERERRERERSEWPEEARRREEELNAEAARRRRELREQQAENERLAAELKERQDAEKTELQKAQEAAKEAQREKEAAEENLRTSRLEIAVRDEASQQGVPSEKVHRVNKLIDSQSISWNEDGRPEGVKDAVEAVLKEIPELKSGSGGGGSSPANPSSGRRGGDDSEITAEEAEKLAREKPDEFNKLFDEGKIPESALGALS